MFSLYEYNQAGHIKVLKEESFNKGVAIGKEEGIAIGESNAQERINRLNEILINANRIDDLKKSTTDLEYQKKLMNELLDNTNI